MVVFGQRQNQGYTVEVGSLVMDEPVVSKSKKGEKMETTDDELNRGNP